MHKSKNMNFEDNQKEKKERKKERKSKRIYLDQNEDLGDKY